MPFVWQVMFQHRIFDAMIRTHQRRIQHEWRRSHERHDVIVSGQIIGDAILAAKASKRKC